MIRSESLDSMGLSGFRNSLAALIVLAACSVFPEIVWAQESRSEQRLSQAREYFERGKRHAERGDYKKATQEYLIAYQLSKAPKLLYNLGQTYWLAGDRATALRYFDLYLEFEPDGEFSDQVRGLREVLMNEIAEEEGNGSVSIGDAAPGIAAEALEPRDVESLPEPAGLGPPSDDAGVAQSQPADLQVRVGAIAQSIIDYKARGMALQVGASLALGKRLELRAAGLVGPTMGTYVGAVAYLAGERWRPSVAAGMPVFFSDGLRAGVRGGGGMDWRLSRRWSVLVEVGAEFMMNPEDDRERFVLVPMAGVRADGF